MIDERQEKEAIKSNSNEDNSNNILMEKLEQFFMEKTRQNHQQTKEGKTNDDKDDSVISLVRKKEQEEEYRKLIEKEIEETTKFNIGIKDFIESNKNYLPKETKGIYEMIYNSPAGSNVDKKNEFQKSVLKLFFENKNSFDELNETKKEKAKEFLGFVSEKQNRLAGQYWDILSDHIENRKRIEGAIKADKINRGLIVSDEVERSRQEAFKASSDFYNIKAPKDDKVVMYSKS
jgi:hypothetical protein